MATVYLARDLKHDRDVAVKVLRDDVGFALGAERFRREIELVTHLSHPHILPIYDSGQADGELFYVMPYVEGESLRAKLNRERQLSIDEALRITCEVASALDHSHRHGIIHRDIKPENILLEDGQALLADFGIARASSLTGEKLTSTGVSLGTPTYMSPEQAMADPSLDGRSDIYSLGCVLYYLVVGRPPFDAEGLATRTAFELPQRILWEMLDDFVLVPDAEIRTAVRLMIETTRNLAEPAGAAPLAAALQLKDRLNGRRLALILSGSNITTTQLRELLAS